MNIAVIRARFPEYDDMCDEDLQSHLSEMFMPETEEEEEEDDSPDYEAIVGQLSEQLSGITEQLKTIAKKEGKPEIDNTPHLLAIGMQLANIGDSIKSIELPKMPEITIPPLPIIDSLEVERDEFNNITRLTPKYRT